MPAHISELIEINIKTLQSSASQPVCLNSFGGQTTLSWDHVSDILHIMYSHYY